MCSNRQADQNAGLERNHEHASTSGSKTNIRLCFLNDLKTPVYTGRNITAEKNTPIRIGVFEGDKMIENGPLSKVKVEIIVLQGNFSSNYQDNWTEEELNNHIVQGRDGQGFVLGGDCSVRLINGQAALGQIRFRESSSRTPNRKFIMAARVCKSENTGVHIQEAVMKPVTVLDRRNEANEKSYPPKLDDGVYRLEEIAKDGAYHRRLKLANILTVQDFLKALNKDANELRKILQMKRQHNSWEKMVRHATECFLEDRHELKSYQNEEAHVVLFFNCVNDLVGAVFHGHYVAYDEFDPAQKAVANKLKKGTHEKLEGAPFDYVMKGKHPEPISSSTSAAAGPFIIVPDTSQANPSGELAANQGAAAGENLWHDENHVRGTFYQNANCDPSTFIPDGLNTHNQDQGAPPRGQQQVSTSTTPHWPQNPQGPIQSLGIFDEIESWMKLNNIESFLDDGPSAAPNSATQQVPQL